MTVTSRSPQSIKVALGLALALIVLAITVGAALYQWHYRQERQSAAATLSAIADLKIRQVSSWLDERIGDAGAVAINSANIRAAADCLESQTGCETLVGALRAMLTSYGYHSGAIVAPDGRVIARAGPEYALHSEDLAALGRLLAGGGARLSDLHVNERDVVELEVAAPIINDSGVIAVVFLVIDAERALFPLVTSWPMQANSGQSLLLRTEGTNVLVLTRPYPDGASMTELVPLESNRMEAYAALEGDGLFSAHDHRGMDTLGVARTVPGTHWVLLVKQDAEDVRSTVRWSAAATAVITGMFVVMTGIVVLIWISGRLSRARLQEEGRRRLFEAHTDWLRRFGNDIVLLVDMQGHVIDANDRAESAYGYTRDELLQLSVHQLRSLNSDMRQSPLTLDAGKGEGQVFKTWHRRKDGSEFPVEVSLRALMVDGQRMYQDIIRDISDRLAAEATINRQARMYAALSQANRALIRAPDKQALLSDLCDTAVRLGGFRGAWVAMSDESGGDDLKIVSLRGDMGAWQGKVRLSMNPQDPSGASVTAAAIREGRPQFLLDVQSVPRLGAWREIIEDLGLKAVAAFPVRECGEVRGAFTVFATDNVSFDPETLSLLEEMADDLSFGLDHLQRENWRRIAEESLRQSEIRYRALVEDHPGMLCRFLSDGTLTFVNDAYCHVFGRPAHQLLGSSFYDLIPEEDQEFARQQVAKLGPDLPTLTYVHRAIGVGGEIRWQEWTDRVLIDGQGRIVEYQSAGKDITERVEMEQALRDSQEFLTVMAASTRDAIIVIDDRGRVTFWNNSAETILGYPRDEALGRPVHSLIASAEDEQSFMSNLGRFKETGTGPVVGRTLELQACNKKGEIFPVELAVNAFRLKGAWHAVGVLRDIRDRKEMELSLWQYQKMESLGNLAGGIAHDINNMLQPIQGFAILLQDDVPPESQAAVKIILDAANRIKDLVEQILMFSRKEEIVREPIDISRTVQQALDFLRPTIPSSIQLEEAIASNVGTVIADRTQIHAVLLNLVSNAVDAMDGRVGSLKVTLSSLNPSDAAEFVSEGQGSSHAVIEVRDAGTGMDEKTIARMFDPFFTTKPTGKGTGLGLSIVHTIVDQHGGFIQVHSVPGQGTAIRVWLPLVAAPQEEGDPAD